MLVDIYNGKEVTLWARFAHDVEYSDIDLEFIGEDSIGTSPEWLQFVEIDDWLMALNFPITQPRVGWFLEEGILPNQLFQIRAWEPRSLRYDTYYGTEYDVEFTVEIPKILPLTNEEALKTLTTLLRSERLDALDRDVRRAQVRFDRAHKIDGAYIAVSADLAEDQRGGWDDMAFPRAISVSLVTGRWPVLVRARDDNGNLNTALRRLQFEIDANYPEYQMFDVTQLPRRYSY